jgi:hypothetical protein
MKVKGGEITAISHSPSGQMVAHVQSDDGKHQFLMPFGMPVSLPDIVRGVESELASVDFAKAHALSLHRQLGKPVPAPKPKPSLWVILSWYFRRKK